MSKQKTNVGSQDEIVLYQDSNGKVELEVRFENETVWLSQSQIALLFDSSRTNIVEHIRNIYQEEELAEEATCRKFRQVQLEGTRNVTRNIPHYNLDLILSVGYRVKSKTATRFRQWATTVLKQHLLNGYSINQRRMTQLHKAIEIIARSDNVLLSGVADLFGRYTAGLDLLDDYDHELLSKPDDIHTKRWKLTYKEARSVVDSMKFSEKSALFGQEKDQSFKSAIGAIYQTFDKKELYPGVLEKAANLLYLLVKNHAFIDGNKRIAAALFVYFLDKNGALFTAKGKFRMENNTLAAITLMIALSQPEEKEMMCLLVMNMLSRNE